LQRTAIFDQSGDVFSDLYLGFACFFAEAGFV
jgi:hypothetical protein